MGDQMSTPIHLPDVLRSAQQSDEPTHGSLIPRRKGGLVVITCPVTGVTQRKLQAAVRVERAGKPYLRRLAAAAAVDEPADIHPLLTRKPEPSIRRERI